MARACRKRLGTLRVVNVSAQEEEDGTTVNRDSAYLISVHSNAPTLLSVPIVIRSKEGRVLKITAMIDSGASSCFIRKGLLPKSCMRTRVANNLPNVTLADGSDLPRSSIGGLSFGITVETNGETVEVAFTEVSKLCFPVILGIPWLHRVNPIIDWRKMEVGKDRVLCSMNCQGSRLPKEYSDLREVLLAQDINSLPRRGQYDCGIELKPEAVLPDSKQYSLSSAELERLRKELDENLSKGFIRESKSKCASPVFFVSKKDGSKRLVVDYRILNQATVKNMNKPPLIKEILDRLCGATMFTKLDLRSAYNLIRIKEGDEWKTAFQTRYGLFEYLVMPFGLVNAPAHFQAYMNSIFRKETDLFVIIYLDDILVYSKNETEHVQHVKRILQKLIENGLSIKIEKCEFHARSVEFLGHRVSVRGIDMDDSKSEALQNWKAPNNVKQLQRFLGFANYYRDFVRNY